MKKRIVCFVLTLIMLIGLVPVSALPAAAATYSVSESAITVLKQLEGYSKSCNEAGYIGYGTRCAECLAGKTSGPHILYEKAADSALRAELKTLDAAVNAFASKNGLSLSQGKHDALVLFSFQNGTAWTLGTGELQTAVKSGYTGSKFLDAYCKWNIDESDDNRRMIEANMYLNGVYSSARPSRYVRVYLDPNDGYMSEDNNKHVHYYDVATPVTITLKPSKTDNTFLGWYLNENTNQRVDTLTSTYHGKTLTALWQDDTGSKIDNSDLGMGYEISKSALLSTSVYDKPEGTKITTYIDEYTDKEVTISLAGKLTVVEDRIVSGVHWSLIVEVKTVNNVEYASKIGWVKVKAGSSSTAGSDLSVDLNVTVTNSYLNMRKNASITSAKNGSFSMGDVLRIVDVKNGSDGFLWGQVATSADDDTAIGWVALMYTDYDSVVASSNSANMTENAVATATIVVPEGGYVNVRSDAGINNQIVGALSYGVTVDLYEVKYVNGIRWGRCSTGWFCLSYARVSNLDSSTGTGETGFTNYIYVATLTNWEKDMTVNDGAYEFYVAPNGQMRMEKWEMDANGDYALDENGDKIPAKITSNQLKIGSLRARDNNGTIETWAYTPYGWLLIAEHDGSSLDLDDNVMVGGIEFLAKYYAVSDDVTVRLAPRTDAKREDVLIKGTEFDVTSIVMVGESIWGYAYKVGETDLTYYGWVNLSNQNVSRNASDDFNVSDITSGTTASTTVKMAKVVGTDSLRVRISGSTSAKQLGTLSYGTTAAVLEENNGWYNLDIDVDNDPSTGSWVSGTYLELYEETVGGSTSTGSTAATVETGMGIVANTYTGVNIRSGAGTAYGLVGKYITGTTVEILEVKTVGAAKWGRTEKGWVCMDYIVMVDNYLTSGSTGTGSSTTTSSNIVIYTGHTTDEVTIYKNTTTSVDESGNVTPVADAVRVVDANYPVTVHEIITQVEYEDDSDTKDENDGQTTTIKKRTSYWARVNEGYIYAPGDNIELDTLDEHSYTVSVAKTRMFADGDWDEVSDDIAKDNYLYLLDSGTKVYVTKLHIRNSEVWCYAECADYVKEGWVCLTNLDKGFASSTTTEEEDTSSDSTTSDSTTETTPSTVIGSTGNTGGSVGASGYKYTGKVINTNEVNVRATASTTASITTTLKRGASLVIYETVISEYMAWGRCDSGWVYLYYVDLTPVGNGAVDARVVYNDNTVIYSDMNGTEKTGSTYCKMAVVDIYEIVGKMARTELGWISTDNLL